MTSLHLIAALPLRPAQTNRSTDHENTVRRAYVRVPRSSGDDRLGNGRMIRYAATRA
jgi:hypothetical protein